MLRQSNRKNMKKISFFNKSMLAFLVATITIQPLTAITTVELKDFYTRFTRGAACFLKRKKCNPEDKRAVWQVGGLITLALTALGYTQWGRMTSLWVGRPAQPREELLSKAEKSKEQQSPKGEQLVQKSEVVSADHPMIIAVQEGQIETVRKLANDPKNVNITFGKEALLKMAVRYAFNFSDAYDYKARVSIVKILLDHHAKAYDVDNQTQAFITMQNADECPDWIVTKCLVLVDINALWKAAQK
jgi:hypothetical protein